MNPSLAAGLPGKGVKRSQRPMASLASLARFALGLSAWAAPAVAAAAPCAATCASLLGGEGTAAPLLSVHLETGPLTSLVADIAPGGAGRVDVWLVALEKGTSTGRIDGLQAGLAPLARTLRRSRVLDRRVLLKGSSQPAGVIDDEVEGQRWAVPPALFGQDLTLAVLVCTDSTVQLASLRLPLADPSDPLLIPPAAGSIAVNEFMKDPAAVSDTRGEWLELTNLTHEPIDIEGWTLRDDGSNRTVLLADGAGIVIPPGGFVVLGRSADTSVNGGVVMDATYSGFTLANGADQIVLEAPGGFVIDRVDYLDAGAEGWPDESGASISLSPRWLGTPFAREGSAWCAGTSPFASGDLGTPGLSNPDC